MWPVFLFKIPHCLSKFKAFLFYNFTWTPLDSNSSISALVWARSSAHSSCLLSFLVYLYSQVKIRSLNKLVFLEYLLIVFCKKLVSALIFFWILMALPLERERSIFDDHKFNLKRFFFTQNSKEFCLKIIIE